MLKRYNSEDFPGEDERLRVMFAARKRVFIDILKWDLPVLGGRYEVDQFDTRDAEYLILLGGDGAHRASARLLPADGPHILRDLYPCLCAGPVPSGPTTREISRFCLDPRQTAQDRRIARDQLVTALVHHARLKGITDYTGVASTAWFDKIARFGWDCRPLGEPMRIGRDTLIGLHIRIAADTFASLEAAGIASTHITYPATISEDVS